MSATYQLAGSQAAKAAGNGPAQRAQVADQSKVRVDGTLVEGMVSVTEPLRVTEIQRDRCGDKMTKRGRTLSHSVHETLISPFGEE